ncbi:MAG: hypothetical protein FJW31_07215 [Acidobacteria bacterium]|nr:hypothetical protein [Acidobacteriota bacterium]
MPEPHRPSSELLVGLLDEYEEPVVLASALAALGHLADPDTAPEIARFRRNADEGVRFDAAIALGFRANDLLAIACLIELTRDASAKVRDWAAFGIGCQSTEDTEASAKRCGAASTTPMRMFAKKRPRVWRGAMNRTWCPLSARSWPRANSRPSRAKPSRACCDWRNCPLAGAPPTATPRSGNVSRNPANESSGRRPGSSAGSTRPPNPHSLAAPGA